MPESKSRTVAGRRFVPGSRAVLTLFTVAVGVALLTRGLVDRRARATLEQRADALTELAAATLGPALLTGDRQTVSSLFETTFQFDDLAYAFVVAPDGQRSVSWHRDPATEGTAVVERERPLDGGALGTLHLGFAGPGTGWGWAFLAGVGVFLFGLGVHLATRRAYRRALQPLQRGLVALTGGQWPEELPLEGPPEAEALTGAFHDMTDHLRRTWDHLRAREERFRALIEYTSDLVLILDRSFLITFASPAGEALLGLRPKALIGTSALDYLHPEDRRPVLRAILRERDTPSDVTAIEARVRHRDGSWRYVAFKARNLFDQPGINGILVNARDISEAKQFEHELVVARDQAEEMVRLKTAFLTNMSHEIRTPLTGILGFAQILRSEVGEPYSDLVTSIEQSGQRLLNTLNSVLDLAQLESESVHLNLAELNVYEEVLGTVQMLKPLAAKKGLALDIKTCSEQLIARLDRVYLHRIINNLVGNAIKFTEAGGVTVQLDVADRSLLIKVRDTGVGIDESFLPDLFSEFKQESTGLGREYEGNGLGLTITRRLVDLMEGEISVESIKGLGSIFCVRFPYDPALQPPPPDRRAPARPAIPPRGPRRAVLAVDDNPDSRRLIERWLRPGFELTTVASGEEALAAARTRRFDVVLMDISLGEALDGVAIMRTLRARTGQAGTRFIALTAYALPGDRERFLQEGFDDYLSKPFREEELLDVLQRTAQAAGHDGPGLRPHSASTLSIRAASSPASRR